MKKLLCLLLAVLSVVSMAGVVAVADTVEITIDGVKDSAYTDNKMLDYTTWQFWDNIGQNTFEPVDYERVKNTVWFNWDDTHVYIYFQCESMDNLYKAPADQTSIPDFEEVFYEIAQIYLDTAPSIEWDAPCIWAGQDGNGDTCAHMACNCRDGAGSGYRLMARANPAWGKWNDYYATASGMFMTFEEFTENYQGKAGYEDLNAAYAAAHGTDGSQAVCFVDYTTNVYGFEMKFPRHEGEDHFQFNIRTRVNEIEWEEYGPELPYSLSFCKAWWTNSDELFDIWYADYESVDPAEIMAIRRMKEALPADLSSIDISHKVAVIELHTAYEKLTDELKAKLTTDEVAYITGAFERIGKLDYIAALGDINEDTKVDAKDALICLRAAVGKLELTEADIARAEVTGDGVVSAKDALEILQFSVKKRTEFTIARTIEL